MNPIWFNDPKGDMPTAKEKKEIKRAFKVAVEQKIQQRAEVIFAQSTEPQFESELKDKDS